MGDKHGRIVDDPVGRPGMAVVAAANIEKKRLKGFEPQPVALLRGDAVLGRQIVDAGSAK